MEQVLRKVEGSCKEHAKKSNNAGLTKVKGKNSWKVNMKRSYMKKNWIIVWILY